MNAARLDTLGVGGLCASKTDITLCDQPREYRKGGNILIQGRRVEFVHRIISGVMQVEIITPVLVQSKSRYSCSD